MSQIAARSAARAAVPTPSSHNERAHDWLDALEEVPLFEGLSKRHVRRVAKLARVRRFAAGLTYGLALGNPVDEAVALGAQCGAAVLTGRGAYGHMFTGGDVKA